MRTDTMIPGTAVTWGPFIQAAYDQYASDPGQANPAAIKKHACRLHAGAHDSDVRIPGSRAVACARSGCSVVPQVMHCAIIYTFASNVA